MAIRIVCPNGHVLMVRDQCAGHEGRCPHCKAKVVVPAPQRGPVSEDAILDILGPHQAHAPAAPAGTTAEAKAKEAAIPPKKSCERCNREIPVGMRICPHCHTYNAGLSGVGLLKMAR